MVGPGIWQETLKGWKVRNVHCRTGNMARKLKKWKQDTPTVRLGIWWETWQTRKMKNSLGRIWKMVRNREKRENVEIHIVGPWLWQENWKTWKMRHNHCMIWNMARKTEKGEKMWNTHCRTCNISRNLKNVENETQTMFYLEYVEKHSKT